MQVFISWSGDRSRAVAAALYDWLPNVLQAVEPWMSRANLQAGAEWSRNTLSALERSRLGLICLTPENIQSPWMLFEAGALARSSKEVTIYPYLFDLSPSALTGPLVQFQSVQADH